MDIIHIFYSLLGFSIFLKKIYGCDTDLKLKTYHEQQMTIRKVH